MRSRSIYHHVVSRGVVPAVFGMFRPKQKKVLAVGQLLPVEGSWPRMKIEDNILATK